MKFIETGIEDLWEINPSIHRDHRGYFMESFHTSKFDEMGISSSFVQDNQSFSKKGVLRGLHFQKPPFSQGKLISVLQGEVLDIVVDIRKSSATYGKYFSCVLNDKKYNMLYVPEGMAHGFLALKDSLFAYKCTNFYHHQSEAGIVWNDPDLAIDWGSVKPILSEKDAVLPTFREMMEKL
ncbi:MAG: dTDP-4-dehydrorhamnose 3,5-epimerase [Cyclobacteriaceae bacterium]|nr:MAG: dTDP-4-dehydrorhamnose 3,5-epimerase [Cyclobacteriaceae bacterium]